MTQMEPCDVWSHTEKIKDSCLVLLSGGQDSTTALFWAIHLFQEVNALSFAYGQRHEDLEIQAAGKVASLAKIFSHTILPVDTLKRIGDSTLLSEGDISKVREGTSLPSSFVPGRNILFLTLAGMYAYKINCHHLVIGVSQEDYSGYPDCREVFLSPMMQALRFGLDYPLSIHSPFLNYTKAQEIIYAQLLPGCMEALKWTHTCYEGTYPPCGECPSCILREKGFKKAGIPDPLFKRMEV